MSNQQIPANGTVMSDATINRRNVLAGSAAALSALAVTNLPASAAANPDAKLEHLFELYKVALDRYRAAEQEWNDTWHELEKQLPEEPPEPSTVGSSEYPDELKPILRAMTFEQLARKQYPEPLRRHDEEQAQIRADAEKAWSEFTELRKKLSTEYGLDAIEVRNDKLFDIQYDIRSQIFDTPAQTLRGVQIKMRAIELEDVCVNGSPYDNNPGTLAVIEDMRRILRSDPKTT